jgi:hypothetical protein
VPQIQVHRLDAHLAQGPEHQLLDLQVGLDAGMAVQLRSHLQRLAGLGQAVRQGVEHAAGVAQAHRSLPVEQMGVDPRGLGRDVRTEPHGPARELVHQLEGLEVHVVTGTGQQGRQVFQQRGNHQLVAIAAEQVQQRPAHLFEAQGLRRQNVLNVFGK